MNRTVALFTAAALSLGAYTTAHAYSATASVTFTWAAGGTSIGWTSNGANNFPDPTIDGNNTQVFLQGGNNSTSYYNSDFAITSDYNGPGTPTGGATGTDDDCQTLLPGFETIELRKYSCRHRITPGGYGYQAPVYHPAPVTDASSGAAASGTLTVTDTTLTGTLTVISTTDEPSGGTTVLFQGVNIGISSGNGTDGYNVRTADGSPFGNAWYGITTAGTLNVNLSGTFTNASWTIDGGVVTFSDAGFACQQGGLGGDARGTLCTPSTTGGGFQPNGGHLSWGMDVDGAGTGVLVATPIQVRDPIPSPPATQQVLATLSGVLAHLAVDVGGAIATTDGEFRFALGSAGGGCLDYITWGDRPSPETGTGIICGTLSAGPLVITGTAVEGGGGDTDPDPFSFTDQTDVALSSVITSDTITISGIDAPAPISVSGAASSQYSVNSGAYTNAAGTVNNGDTVSVRHTSSASASTATDTTLTIGTVPDTFTSTTIAGDPDIDPFTFVDQTDVQLSTLVTSAAITVSGINVAVAIAVSGDASSLYSVNGGAYTAVAGTVSNGDTVTVRHLSSATPSTDVDTVLDIGGVQDTFTSTTVAEDTTPAAFTFTNQPNVALSTAIVSAPVTITGINTATPVSIGAGSAAGSDYSVGCTGTFTSAAGTVTDGQTVCVRHTSSASFSTATDTILDVGGVPGTFTSTTVAIDTTPDAFSFTDESDVALAATVTSDTITVSGINSPATLALSGDASSTCSVNGGAFAAACAATVSNGDTVQVQHTSADTEDTDVTTTLTIGGVADDFTSTTESSGGGVSLREDDGGSSLDALILALLGFTALIRRRR